MNALLLVSAMAFAPAAPLPASAPLQWKLAKGDTFYTKTTTNTNQTVTVMGMDMEQESEQIAFVKYKVIEADDKGYTIEQTTQKTTIKGNLPGVSEYADKMKDLVLTLSLDKNFEVKKIEGVDKMLEKIAGDNEMAKKMLGTMMGEENLKQSVAELFRMAPDKAVKVGDKWKKEYKFPLGPLGSFKMDAEYKFAESDKADKILYTAKGEFELPKGGTDSGLPFMITKGTLKGDDWSGEMLFDSKAGRMKSSSMKAKTAGTLTINANGMDIDITIKQDLKSESIVSDKNLADD